MSVVITVGVTLPMITGALSGLVAAAAVAAAGSIGLKVDDTANAAASANSVDIRLNNASEAAAGMSAGQSLRFSGDGVAVEFFIDENGRASVRASGRGSEEELRALGETMAKRIVQQYAYHRVVTEMRERNMNIVEEEIEEDGTVRMRVRIHHG